MGLLRLALEGLRWRRWISLLLLVVAVFTTTAAAAAPSYADSARDAVLQGALRRAPVGPGGSGVQAATQLSGKPSTAALRASVLDAFRGPARAAYPTVVMQLSVLQRTATPDAAGFPYVAVASRDDFCRAVRITAGTCLIEADRTGVVVEQSVARAHGLHLGSRVAVRPPTGTGATTTVVVRGIGVRRDPSSSYWFDGDVDPGGGAVPAWAPQSYFSALRVVAGDGVQATAQLVVDRRAVHASSIDGLSRSLDAAVARLDADASRPVVTTAVEEVVSSGLAGGSRLIVPIAVAIAEFLALGWYLLHTLMGGAAEARGSEVALSKVRGLTGGRTLLLILLEPVLLLIAAVPIGVLLAALAEHALVPVVLGSGTEVRIGWASWVAGAGAAGGGLVAAAAASAAVFRRPALEQWRRTTRSAPRRGVVLEVAVVVLAVAGVVELRLSGALGGATSTGIAVLAPMLVLLAGALLASRLVVLLARLGFGPTRATGAVAVFVGLRQLVRRPAGRRTFGVLVVAVALAVYALSSTAVTARNREDRALTDVGAPTVLHIRTDPGTQQRIRSVDRSGRAVTAVAEVPLDVATASGPFDAGPSSASPSMLVVDPSGFGSVAYWRRDFGSASLTRLLQPLTAAPPRTPQVLGTSIAMEVSARTASRDIALAVDLVDRRGAPITATFGRLRTGTATYTAAVAGCADGCDLRRIYVTRPSGALSLLTARFTVQDVRVLDRGRRGAVQPGVTAVRWSALNPLPPGQATPAERVRVTPAGLEISIVISGSPGDTAPGFGAVAGAVSRLPALVTTGIRGTGSTVGAVSPDLAALVLAPVGRVTVVPRLGDSGAIVPRAWAEAASPSGAVKVQANEIWVSGAAPADTIGRLRAAGVQILSVDRASRRSAALASAGPAFASGLVLAAGGAAVLLAAFAVVLGVVLLARRRTFELSAMRALGIRWRSLFGSVLVEQAVLVLVATASGFGLAVLSAQLALPAVPAYADDPRYPAFIVDQPLGLLLAASAAVAALLIAASAVAAAVLTRGASVGRLREAEQ